MSNYVRLRSTPSHIPSENGMGMLDHELVFYCEKTGDNRLFVMLPDFMGAKLSTEKFGPCAVSHAGKSGRYRSGDTSVKVLAARSPDELLQGWRLACDAYISTVAEVVTEQVIAVRIRRGAHSYNALTGVGARVDVECKRYLRVTGKPNPNRPTAFVWNDDNVPTTKSHPAGSDFTVIPYNERVWQGLLKLSSDINAASDQLYTLVREGNLAERILSGTPLLGVDP